MTLAAQYRDYVVPLIESAFQGMIGEHSSFQVLRVTFVHTPGVERPTMDLAGVLEKEALYCAIGRCATKLQGVIPFNEWMRHRLIVEARESDAK